jgi:hypothetical protein
VYRFDTSGQVLTQYEVWEGPLKFVGKNAFVISESADQVPADLKSAFASFRLVAEIANPNKANTSYFLYLAENLQAWPKSAQPRQSEY